MNGSLSSVAFQHLGAGARDPPQATPTQVFNLTLGLQLGSSPPHPLHTPNTTWSTPLSEQLPLLTIALSFSASMCHTHFSSPDQSPPLESYYLWALNSTAVKKKIYHVILMYPVGV